MVLYVLIHLFFSFLLQLLNTFLIMNIIKHRFHNKMKDDILGIFFDFVHQKGDWCEIQFIINILKNIEFHFDIS